MSGRARVLLIVVMLVSATTCGDSSPTAPASPPPGVGSGELRISGLPASLRSGATAQLTAQQIMGNGTERECAASWSIDDPRVASISSTGLLTARISGYGAVMASCAGLSALGEMKVESSLSSAVIVVPYDSALTTYDCLDATLELLDGPLAGQTIPTACPEPYMRPERLGGTLPVRVRFTAENYESKDVVISEATWPGDPSRPVNLFPVPMTFVADPLTDTFVRTLSSADKEVSYPFLLRAAGTVRVRNWWSLDWNDRFVVELWCGGQRLRQYSERAWANGGSFVGGFTQDVQSAGKCEVKLRPDFNGATLHRLAITYPR